MADRRFFVNNGPFTVAALVTATGASLPEKANSMLSLSDVAPLDRAGANEISFFDNTKYMDQFSRSTAGACFVRAKYATLFFAPHAFIVAKS